MKKAILYVFSGTGNTSLCGQDIAKHLRERDYEVDVFEYFAPVETFPNPNDYDLVGIGYPIYGFNPPEPLFKLVKRLPAVENKPLFFFKTSGEPFFFNNSSSARMWSKLRKKGYRLIMEKHIIMPYNIMFRYNDNLAKQQYLYLDPLCEVLAIRLANGEEDKIKYSVGLRVLSVIVRLVYVAPKVNAPLSSVNRKKCINCDVCIKNCPTKSIYRNKKGKIKFKTSCALCMRCTMNCPKDAIRFGFMHLWRVNGKYDFKAYLADTNNPGDYVNKNTKGYFKLFRKYFAKQNALLTKYGVNIPVVYKDGEKL